MKYLSTWLSVVKRTLFGATRKRTPTKVLPTSAYATVIIPALNEEKRIAYVVATALADSATAQVIVIDDSSIDDTAALARQAGAQVLTSSMLGKGVSMKDGVAPSTCEFIVYLDGDLSGLRDGIVTALCAPMLRGESDFVKAQFGRSSGRVTELTAKPMLKIFFPELAHVAQPLGGIIAARKSLLQTLSFEDGYGVDVGLMLDAHLAGAKIAQVDIGSLEHDSQPLQDLALMANEVGRVIFSRAKKAGRLHVDQITAMYESQRQAAAGIEYVLTRRKGRQRLLLVDMDGTVTSQRFALELARASGNEPALLQLLDTAPEQPVHRSEQIAKLFQYLHKTTFEQVAHALVIRPGVIEFVNQMRRRGFMVGVVSDSYFVAADIVRRRIFADFAMAHTIGFEHDVCNGQLRMNPAFFPDASMHASTLCKSHVLRAFLNDLEGPAVDETWVVGDNVSDLALMRMANKAFAIDPKSVALANEPTITCIDSFEQLLALLPERAAT
jgi:glucosyl-3-phosphoglycerate synthase